MYLTPYVNWIKRLKQPSIVWCETDLAEFCNDFNHADWRIKAHLLSQMRTYKLEQSVQKRELRRLSYLKNHPQLPLNFTELLNSTENLVVFVGLYHSPEHRKTVEVFELINPKLIVAYPNLPLTERWFEPVKTIHREVQ